MTAMREQKRLLVRAIGAPAINQAVKAIIEAGSILHKKAGIDLGARLHWETVLLPHEERPEEKVERSAVCFVLLDLGRR